MKIGPVYGAQFNHSKFQDVILYVCAKCTPRELGMVKLHKILYFADMLHFLDTGQPLTGAPYLKQTFGPTAKPLLSVLSDLETKGRLSLKDVDYFGFVKKEFHVLRGTEAVNLSEGEVALIDDVIDFVCARSAREISELSHTDAWQLAKIGEEIPYYTAYYLLPSETTDDDVAWANETARELSLAG